MLCYHQDHVDIFRRWSKFGHRFDKKVGQKIVKKLAQNIRTKKIDMAIWAKYH